MSAFRTNDSGKKYAIKILSQNKDIDLAIIEIIGAPSFTELEQAKKTSVDYEDKVIVAGFPNHYYGDRGYFAKGEVVGFRIKSTINRFLISASIIGGNSGGPVLNKDYQVIGIAVTGADSFQEAGSTEDHGVIPISALVHLEKKPEPI